MIIVIYLYENHVSDHGFYMD